MPILSEGARLANRYKLIRRLASGGMAEVWLAKDPRTDASVALKMLASDIRADARYKELLAREWRICSRLMHANIIRVFEFHDEPDGAFYALQYVGEATIAALCGEALQTSMRPIAMIADALRYAHGKDIVHRDIKASNILLDSRGLPYLTDFGVAARAGDADMAASGSAIASSPQQRAGEPASASDDIFALGVLMYELLTGSPPANTRLIDNPLADGTPMPAALAQLLSDMLGEPANRPDAEIVAKRLQAAGFAPGPAPARLAVGERVIDEVVESVGPVRRSRPAVAPAGIPQSATGSPGLSPKIVLGALGTAVVALLVVVFILPEIVNTPPKVTVPAADPDAPAQSQAETASVEEAGEEATPSNADFNENAAGASGLKANTDDALGDLLSQLERLRYRGIERWGGQAYLDAVDVYAEGDRAYIDRNYRLAGEKYLQASRMLTPFFERIDTVFEETMTAAKKAFAAEDPAEAVRLFDLAVSITPGNRDAEAGLERASNLGSVLSLMVQAARFEKSLELDAAKQAFEKALALDAAWQPAIAGLARIRDRIRNMSFEQRMTEGFEALAAGNYDSARAAFNAAKLLVPGSSQPADGLMQVDQEVRLSDIRRLENEVATLEQEEKWESAVAVYENILDIDPDLQFAREGLAIARSRAALHKQLDGYIAEPDSLSDPVTMQNATLLLLELSRMGSPGPRITDQKNELSRLLKRAATPLPIQLVSDSLTQVSILKVGRFGTFSSQQVELRPGRYIAVGIRQGYRDVRVEFRVAPEIDLEPIVVQTEEPI